jgi:adenosylcobinamide-phosphate synthase
VTGAQAGAAGLLAGAWLDRRVGDPQRFHPVAGFGQIADWLERRWYADDDLVGAGYVLVLAGGATAVTRMTERALPPPGRLALTGLVTAVALGGTSLRQVALSLADLLRNEELEAARERLGWLCSRDPSTLDAEGLARATIESVAENTSDAVVGTLVWGALLGPSGVVLHRTVNTLDAMVGYRTSRYLRFGRAAARTDDLVNLVPARVTALLTVMLAPSVGGRPRDAWQSWRRDAAGHPSPNAGPVEAAAAGALGLTLGGDVNRYGDHEDRRPAMGDGASPMVADIERAVALSHALGLAALVLAIGIAAVRDRLVARGPGRGRS